MRLNQQLGNICSFQLVPHHPLSHAASWERESRQSLEASLGCGVGLRVQNDQVSQNAKAKNGRCITTALEGVDSS